MARTLTNDLSAFGRYRPQGAIAKLLDLTRGLPSSWAGRRWAYFLRSLAMKAMKGRPLDVEALGARMRLYPYNNLCEKRILFTPQYFDPAELDLLRARITPDFSFIDICANIGGYSLFAAAVAGPRARILAIEPQPEIFERLIYNIEQNPFATIKAIACAVADQDSEITLFIDTENRGESSICIINSDALTEQVRVTGKALLSIVSEEGFERIDAIKLDVEGAEDLILEPFFRDAPKSLWPGLIFLEYAPERWSIDLAPFLIERGYTSILETRRKACFQKAPMDNASMMSHAKPQMNA